jgi:DNA-binding response OmpR family regulator
MDLHPALMILDITAPETEPWLVAEKIREVKTLKNMPTLVLASGELSAEDEQKVLELEAQGMLKRPVSVETLTQEIQRILSRTI